MKMIILLLLSLLTMKADAKHGACNNNVDEYNKYTIIQKLKKGTYEMRSLVSNSHAILKTKKREFNKIGIPDIRLKWIGVETFTLENGFTRMYSVYEECEE